MASIIKTAKSTFAFTPRFISNRTSIRTISRTSLKMSPIPVVVIGARVQVANAVRKGLEPEYDGEQYCQFLRASMTFALLI